MYKIIKEIKEPVFADKIYSITDFVVRTSFLSTEAINKAINKCSETGEEQYLFPMEHSKQEP